MNRQDYLNAAADCVCKSREEQYGSPENSFEVIAQLWEVYVKAKCVGGKNVDVCIFLEDVANMMALLKIGRISTGRHKDDSYIDAIGYLACAGEIASGKKDRGI